MRSSRGGRVSGRFGGRGRGPSSPPQTNNIGSTNITGQCGGRGSGRGGDQGRGRGINIGSDFNFEPDVIGAPTIDAVMDEAELLSLGLSLAGFCLSRQNVCARTNMERFKAHYAVGPLTIRALLIDLKEEHHSLINEKDFFMALNWLKLYDTEHVLAGRWKFHEETIRDKVQAYTKKIQLLKSKKIRLDFKEFDDDEVYVFSVDGVHFTINEVRTKPGPEWFDPKSHSAGLAYEVAVAIRSSRIVWTNGPHPASKHDMTIFRGGTKKEKTETWEQNSLYFKIPAGKKAIGDSGYAGEPEKIAISLPGHSVATKKFFARIKSRHETVNSRFKFFNILDHRFRHGREKHKMCFEAVCVIVQYDMENGHPLFEVK